MWTNWVNALKMYSDAIIEEWIDRGYNNTLEIYYIDDAEMPPWIGNEAFHLSHQSNLLRKDFNHYRKYFKDISTTLPYVWPEG